MSETTDTIRKKKKEPKKVNPVLRKLRIEFIITMMTIVVLFLLSIFGVQYISSKKTMESDSRTALEQALNTASFPWDRGKESLPGFPGGMDVPDDMTPPDLPEVPSSDELSTQRKNRSDDDSNKKDKGYRISDFKDRQDRVAILLAFYNTDGSVSIERNNIFFIDSTDVESLVRSAIEKKEDDGQIEDHNLRYMRKKLENGTVAVAFADISNERSILSSDLWHSVWISLGVILVMFFLSLWLSRITMRPVERAWNDQRRFVADASHELKTPLTVIMSNTDMVDRSLQKLVDEADPNAEQTTVSLSRLQRNLHRMDNLREESLRMKELIGELLEVARGDVGQHPENFTEISLSEIVEDALLTWESIFFEAGKTLNSEVEPDLTINGDRTLLRRLTEILIDNALKYSSDASTVTVSLRRDKTGGKKQIRLSVENEGTPLTAEEISHLFDRFYRADSSREKTSGYGLGLSIAESIVTAHKGNIRAEATATGNVFYVTW